MCGNRSRSNEKNISHNHIEFFSSIFYPFTKKYKQVFIGFLFQKDNKNLASFLKQN